MGGLSLGAPLALAGLLALPVIWYLLRVTPPAPQRERFFGLRFLLGLKTEEETPDKTPLWLLILRLVAAALIVLAMAEPVLNAATTLAEGDDTLVVVVDDDWAAAHRWDERRDAMQSAIDEARRDDIPVVLAPTAAPDFDIKIEDPSDAMARAMAMEPQPLKPDRATMAKKLKAALGGRHAHVLWLADGIDNGDAQSTIAAVLDIGEADVMLDDTAVPPLALAPPTQDANAITVPITRADDGPAIEGSVEAFGEGGRFVATASFTLKSGERQTTARIEAPDAMRNGIERIAIDNRASAGSVVLLDESARRRPVGIVSGDDGQSGQPLLSPTYYLERALDNSAEAYTGSIAQHLQRGVSVIVLADVGQVIGEAHDDLAAWVGKGGVLVRFAGPRLAVQGDDLLPVRLRAGGVRALGGTLSWEKPQGLGAFPASSPFAGLKIPDDIEIRRQVMAEPSLQLEERTWASLADGTPLVTAEKRGQGWLVLFHITANADWSNLPISGLFVEMLKRVIALGPGVASNATATAAAGTLNPHLVLDGFGRLTKPGTAVTPIPRSGASPSPEHPPGLYGEAPNTVAVNLFAPGETLAPFPVLPGGAAVKAYGAHVQVDFKPFLLAAALLLLFADAIASLILRGYRFRLGRHGTQTAASVMLMIVLATAGISPPARADDASADAFALKAVLKTHLAYVKTGDSQLDQMSKEGLEGLTRILNERTAVTADVPIEVNLDKDDLAFFPLIYWPIPDGGAPPSDAAIARIDAYMKNGGTVLFDTRDGRQGGPASDRLQDLLKKLDLPPLQRVPRDHVLTKAFYLLNEFPGRQAGGDVWVEAQGGDGGGSDTVGDGVSSVVIGAGDWAAAWASDEFSRPLYPMGAGGERQREYAYRFGVNLVMYALTGNYKADQVHVPALLERMGQ